MGESEPRSFGSHKVGLESLYVVLGVSIRLVEASLQRGLSLPRG